MKHVNGRKSRQIGFIAILTLVGILLFSDAVLAFTTADEIATTAWGKDIYDMIVTNGIKGYLGYAFAVILIVFGLYVAVFKSSIFMPVGCLIAAGIMIKIDSVLTGLGFTL